MSETELVAHVLEEIADILIQPDEIVDWEMSLSGTLRNIAVEFRQRATELRSGDGEQQQRQE